MFGCEDEHHQKSFSVGTEALQEEFLLKLPDLFHFLHKSFLCFIPCHGSLCLPLLLWRASHSTFECGCLQQP